MTPNNRIKKTRTSRDIHLKVIEQTKFQTVNDIHTVIK